MGVSGEECEQPRRTHLGSTSQVQPPPASAHSSPRRVMSSDTVQSLPSNTSINTKFPVENWDSASGDKTSMQTNSVAFPGEGKEEEAVPVVTGSKPNRTLSDLLKLHAEKGTRFACSPEEATRLADVLGQWVRLPRSQKPPSSRILFPIHCLQHDCVLMSCARPFSYRLTQALRRTKPTTTSSRKRTLRTTPRYRPQSARPMPRRPISPVARAARVRAS